MTISDYQTALVTGASSGIGEAVVEDLVKRGLTVHAIARRADRLEELKEKGVTIYRDIIEKDSGRNAIISDPDDYLISLFCFCKSRF